MRSNRLDHLSEELRTCRNIAHSSVLVQLLQGQFNYEDRAPADIPATAFGAFPFTRGEVRFSVIVWVASRRSARISAWTWRACSLATKWTSAYNLLPFGRLMVENLGMMVV